MMLSVGSSWTDSRGRETARCSALAFPLPRHKASISLNDVRRFFEEVWLLRGQFVMAMVVPQGGTLTMGVFC